MSKLQPFDVWTRNDWTNQEVAGEQHHVSSWRSLFPRSLPIAGLEVRENAVLLREPDNPFDPNAIAVVVRGATVGYVPAEDAQRYRGILDHLAALGWVARTPARLWGSPEIDYSIAGDGEVSETRTGRVHCRISIALPEPHLLVPMNNPPRAPHSMLPMGGSVLIKNDDVPVQSFEAVLNTAGEAWVHVTLHAVREELARSVREVVEVRIDGRRAGQLTPAMSKKFLPIIQTLADQERLCGAPALVRGNRLKVDLRLHATQASELSESWLLEHANHAVVSRSTATGLTAQNEEPPSEPQDGVPQARPVVGVAGWFPDPQGIAPLRFWDGSEWTSRIRMN